MSRTVFFVSDGTGITAESLGHSLLTQFEHLNFEYVTVPYVNSLDKLQPILAQIEHAYQATDEKPLVFSTLVDPVLSLALHQSPALTLDLFRTFLTPLEQELGCQSSHLVGRTHGVKSYSNYMIRIDAVNYSLGNDDGSHNSDYGHADVILVGVSRCGKTPTCLYLALQFGIFAANYPLTEEAHGTPHLPDSLKPYRDKLFGLSIDPLRLQKIREERRPNSVYASLENCQTEVKNVIALFKREHIPYLDTTTRSIEEIASEIMAISGIKRRLY